MRNNSRGGDGIRRRDAGLGLGQWPYHNITPRRATARRRRPQLVLFKNHDKRILFCSFSLQKDFTSLSKLLPSIHFKIERFSLYLFTELIFSIEFFTPIFSLIYSIINYVNSTHKLYSKMKIFQINYPNLYIIKKKQIKSIIFIYSGTSYLS